MTNESVTQFSEEEEQRLLDAAVPSFFDKYPNASPQAAHERFVGAFKNLQEFCMFLTAADGLLAVGDSSDAPEAVAYLEDVVRQGFDVIELSSSIVVFSLPDH